MFQGTFAHPFPATRHETRYRRASRKISCGLTFSVLGIFNELLRNRCSIVEWFVWIADRVQIEVGIESNFH